MASASVRRVQQMVQQAKATFSRSRTDQLYSQDVEKLITIMSQLTADDFNVNSSIVDKSWDFPPFIKDAPAAFMDIYECSQFSISIFMLKAKQNMPLHNHPHMFGIMKVLLGSMVVTSYNQPQVSADVKPPYLASFFNTVEATPTSDVCVLHPEQGNIHEIKAQDTPVAFLDILAPPYDPEDGRDCTYFTMEPAMVETNDRCVWLTPGKHPSWFSCVPQPYHGPKVQ